MSLQILADQMKSRGRGGDTELVHMTKGEVAGLQQLAMAAGGSLTINPDTGLPEASFLRQILPTIIGVGLAPFTGGLSAAALGAGAGAMLNPDDPLMGAVTGGMGAFGGAQLGAGLSAAGGAGAAGAGLTSTAPTQVASTLGAGASAAPGSQAAMLAAQNTAGAAGAVPTAATAAYAGAPTTYSGMYQGIGALAEQPGRDAFMQSVGGGKGLMRSGMMAAAPMAMPGRQRPVTEDEDTEDIMGRYTYDPGFTGGERLPGSAYTSERRFFNPRFIRNAQGGAVKKYADGGEASADPSVFDPARGMTGASADAMRFLYGMDAAPGEAVPAGNPAFGMTGQSADAMQYLQGLQPRSAAPQMPPAAQTPFVPPVRAQETTSSIRNLQRINDGEFAGMYQASTPKYAFDPDSQRFFRTDPVFRYVAPAPAYYGGGGGGGSDFGGFGGSGFGGAVGSPGLSMGSSSSPGANDGVTGPGGNAAGVGMATAAQGGSIYRGGIASLAQGGMREGGFVFPADVVALLGEGNTEAGYATLEEMFPTAVAIRGPDGGQADTVETTIEGEQPAAVAHGEVYLPPEEVKRAGGAKKLYAMLENVRKQAMGTDRQVRPVDPNKALA